ncbi:MULTISPECIES: hypothetical protein [Arthrobacter]|uniref:hypothetical protein n=1 Tax=Arthrobacter TaxID=1663 RepID=UPI0012B628AA|nr:MULTISPECIES: hypothetical protein [Arthrobacter]
MLNVPPASDLSGSAQVHVKFTRPHWLTVLAVVLIEVIAEGITSSEALLAPAKKPANNKGNPITKTRNPANRRCLLWLIMYIVL